MKKEEKIKFVKKSFSMPESVYNKIVKKAQKENRTVSNMLVEIINGTK